MMYYNKDRHDREIKLRDWLIGKDFSYYYVVGFTQNGPIVVDGAYVKYGAERGKVSLIYLKDSTRRVLTVPELVPETHRHNVDRAEQAIQVSLARSKKRGKTNILECIEINLPENMVV